MTCHCGKEYHGNFVCHATCIYCKQGREAKHFKKIEISDGEIKALCKKCAYKGLVLN